MAKAQTAVGLMASGLLLWGAVAGAAAAPTAEDMLRFRPKQDVGYTTPAAAEHAACKVELIKMQRGSGWLLRDPKGQVLRRFFDTTGSGKTDAWCYYQNGVEVYREIYSEKGDTFRWVNAGGMKYGIDANRDGKIDSWRSISPEEVSQEALQAVARKDFARLQALMLPEAELKALDLPAGELNRVREVMKGSPTKFQQTVAKLNLSEKVRWVHMETQAPQCAPAEANGLKQDLVKYAQVSVTYFNEAVSKTETLQLGELIQVGATWRLIDAPVPSEGGGGELVVHAGGSEASTPAPNKEQQTLLKELEDLDKTQPNAMSAAPNELAVYNARRADILEKLAAKSPADERDQWLRQVADCLAAAIQNGDKAAHNRLLALRDKAVKDLPTSNLTGHLVFAEMSADYSVKISQSGVDVPKLQKEWLERLAKFVQDFPKVDDAPDGLMQLGMISELVGEEEKAKKWYELLVKDFPNHTHAPKARGAAARLALDGKDLALTGAVLGTGASFDLKTLKGKIVVVYYWASWNQQCAQDFTRLKALLPTFAAKGLEIVCVNLDNSAPEATAFLQKNPAPGTHLHEDGGLSSKLAEPYGIMVLPTLFLVNAEGKVVSRTVQINSLEDEIKKLVK